MTPDEIKRKLHELSEEQNINYNHLLLHLAFERLIQRLTNHPELTDSIVFKGGFVALKVYENYRYTRDLDLTAMNLKINQIEEALKDLIDLKDDGFWFGELEKHRLPHQHEYGGVRFQLRYTIGDPPKKSGKAPIVQLDIGMGDVITPGPVLKKSPSIIEAEPLSWKVYPPETIVAEKLDALCRHENTASRGRDLYDLVVLIPKCDDATLKKAITATFEHTGNELPSSFSELFRKMNKEHLELSFKKISRVDGSNPDFKKTQKELLKLFKERIDRLLC